MSELTDLIIQVGDSVGWSFVLLVMFTYELYFPSKFHFLGGTKLQRLLREPAPGVIAALEAVYKQHESLSREELIDKLNGDTPRAWEFEITATDLGDRHGGD